MRGQIDEKSGWRDALEATGFFVLVTCVIIPYLIAWLGVVVVAAGAFTGNISAWWLLLAAGVAFGLTAVGIYVKDMS